MRNIILKLVIVACSLLGLRSISFAEDTVQHAQNATATVASKNWDNDAYWKWGVFYFNKDDSRLLPPKRDGMGWTVNFANPFSLGLMVLIIVATAIYANYYKKKMAGNKNPG